MSSADISVVGRHAKADESNAGEGAGIGAVLGGAAGLLAGIGLIAIPGIGPVVAAGWLASTAAGAAAGGVAGGIVGALTSAGHSDEDANYYAETIRRGGTVVSVRAADEQVPAVEPSSTEQRRSTATPAWQSIVLPAGAASTKRRLQTVRQSCENAGPRMRACGN